MILRRASRRSQFRHVNDIAEFFSLQSPVGVYDSHALVALSSFRVFLVVCLIGRVTENQVIPYVDALPKNLASRVRYVMTVVNGTVATRAANENGFFSYAMLNNEIRSDAAGVQRQTDVEIALEIIQIALIKLDIRQFQLSDSLLGSVQRLFLIFEEYYRASK